MRGRAAVLLWLVGATVPAVATDDSMRQGEYIFRAAGCANCHTDEENKGAPLTGGHALKTLFGTFYAPNITPDPETGIGSWSETNFVRALREGISPGVNILSHLTQDDRHAIVVYLKSLPPLESLVHERKPEQKKPKTLNDYE